jgi:hypothetical protein
MRLGQQQHAGDALALAETVEVAVQDVRAGGEGGLAQQRVELDRAGAVRARGFAGVLGVRGSGVVGDPGG